LGKVAEAVIHPLQGRAFRGRHIDWYYHAPDTGRVGPLSAAKLCKRFQERRIQREALLWHHDLREWQPLERTARTVGDYALRTSRCPDNDDPHVARLGRYLLRRAPADARIVSIEGGSAFELALNADGQLTARPCTMKPIPTPAASSGNAMAAP
jgi:hypothetical protein